jgi:drug/metabolite transporter (DMT)-like permease
MTNNKNNPKAILLILVGMTVFALQDTFVKLLSDDTNIYLIYFIRSAVGLLVIFTYLKIKKIPIIIKTHYPLLTIIRTMTFFFGFSLYYYSLTKLSLALAVTLFFVSPFFVTIFSMIIIKEHIGIRRWMAILVGFVGVFLVMDPKIESFNIYLLFPVICAVCYSFTVIIQKKTADKDSLFSQIIHIYISAIIFSIIIKSSLGIIDFDPDIVSRYKFLLVDWNISNYLNFFMLIAIGLTGVTGFLCLFGAYNIGSPATIAPFEYVIILWAILISWFVWDETLSIKAFVGLILIISAGIYTFLREVYLNKKISIDRPLR